MPAPRKGKEVRQIVAIRLEPSEKELLKKHFGGVQAAVDSILEKIKRIVAKDKVGQKSDTRNRGV